MDYYTMRRKVAGELNEYLKKVDLAVLEGQDPPSWADFRKEMLLRYGASTGTIKSALEMFGLTMNEHGDVVKQDEAQ